MLCPYCGVQDSKVLDSRNSEAAVRRRRECISCSRRFTTYERPQSNSLFVIKQDGRREPFSREKLLDGLLKACAKRPLPTGKIESIVTEIELDSLRQGRGEIPSVQIGELVMNKLRDMDRVAYIRFASVYRDFSEIDDFRVAAEALLHEEGERVPSAQLPLLFPEVPASRRTKRVRAGKSR